MLILKARSILNRKATLLFFMRGLFIRSKKRIKGVILLFPFSEGMYKSHIFSIGFQRIKNNIAPRFKMWYKREVARRWRRCGRLVHLDRLRIRAEKILKTFKKIAPYFGGVIIPIITVALIFKTCGYDVGSLRTDINNLKENTVKLDEDISKVRDTTTSIGKDVIGICTDIKHIDKSISEVKENTKNVPVLEVQISGLEKDFCKFQEDTASAIDDLNRVIRPGGLGSGGIEEVGVKVAKSYKGRIGIIKEETGATTASGWPYDPGKLVAAKNLNGNLKKVRFGSCYLVLNLEYEGEKIVNVEIVDTFYSKRDVLLAISPAAAREIGFPLKKGIIKGEVHENPK